MDAGGTGRWAQALGFLGVILSLLFVGFEIKQSRDIAEAQVYAQRAELDVMIRAQYIPSDRIYDIQRRKAAGEKITDFELEKLLFAYGSSFIYWENNHFLYLQGLLGKEHWQASRQSMLQTFIEIPDFLAFWDGYSHEYRTSFRNEVDKVVQEANVKLENDARMEASKAL
ncbi:MAG: hypothetical protein ABJK25_02250 [Halieaceae bacterium]